MKVLIACEYSGRVRDAFSKLGHDAVSCDLLPTDTPGPHYEGDVRDILHLGWDMMIAHPDCTYLCSSGLHWNKRGRLVDGRPRQELTEEALVFVQTLLDAPIEQIALENPVGCISTRIRKADQYIQPYEYGHDASKKTGLWLKNLKKITPTKHIAPRWVCCGETLETGTFEQQTTCPLCERKDKAKPRWANQTDSGQNALTPDTNRWKNRARTYQGWADAWAAQWGGKANA